MKSVTAVLGTLAGASPPSRQLAPDVGRGAALALIAAANTMLYLHARPYTLRQHIIDDAPIDRLVSFVNVVAVDGRIYPLFSALLGYGLARQAAGRDRAASAFCIRWRGVGLMIFGAAHGLLLFSGDILGLYGLLMAVLVPALQWSGRTLARAAGLLLLPLALVQGLATPADGTPMTDRLVSSEHGRWKSTGTTNRSALAHVSQLSNRKARTCETHHGAWTRRPSGATASINRTRRSTWSADGGRLRRT